MSLDQPEADLGPGLDVWMLQAQRDADLGVEFLWEMSANLRLGMACRMQSRPYFAMRRT